MLTDLLNTPALVNTQHNHWTVTCQIRAYPVHYTHIFLSRSLHFRHVLNPLFSLNVPPTPPHPQAHTHHTCSFSFFSLSFFWGGPNRQSLRLLSWLCSVLLEQCLMCRCNRVGGARPPAAAERKGSAVVIGHDEVWPVR